MTKKKTKPRNGSLDRKYQVEAGCLPSLQLTTVSDNDDSSFMILPQDGIASNSTVRWFSPEMIQHLIERIKSI
jgi:hypothetical protein